MAQPHVCRCYDRVFRTDTRIKASVSTAAPIPWYPVAQDSECGNSARQTGGNPEEERTRMRRRSVLGLEEARFQKSKGPASGRCESRADRCDKKDRSKAEMGLGGELVFDAWLAFACLSCRPRTITITACPENPSITNTIAC